jgi:lysyl-tRNA synthetase class 2
MSSETSVLLEERRAKLAALRAMEVDVYPHRFEATHTVSQAVAAFGHATAESLASGKDVVRVAGRITALRRHGKAAFADLSDGRPAPEGESRSRFQIYVKQGVTQERSFEIFSQCDLGDIVGAEGTLFRTRTGELTLQCERVVFLSKAMRPMPEKWHGLADVETRHRRRYLDLLANPQMRRVFEMRSRMVRAMRNFLDARDYLEVETPMMHSTPGGAVARPFKTWHEALNLELYLRIAPELYLKRLVVGGFERVYEINRNFRNEGLSHIHNPEFTMLELYQAYSGFDDLMPLTEELICEAVQAAAGSLQVEFRGEKISFERPWKRLRLTEALARHVEGFDDTAVGRMDALRRLAERNHVEISKDAEGPWDLLDELVKHKVEPNLVQPTFLTHLPRAMSPLAKAEAPGSPWAARFEVFAGGMEIANGFSEQNDPEEQLRSFREQAAARPDAHVDEDYILALEHGLPPTAGLGVGVDRVVMLASGQESIREVILFPLLRPRKPQDAEGATPES